MKVCRSRNSERLSPLLAGTSNEKAALAPEVLAEIAHACRSICDAAADQDGFVPIRRLLAGFQATLMARTLFVEGMIASQLYIEQLSSELLVLVQLCLPVLRKPNT